MDLSGMDMSGVDLSNYPYFVTIDDEAKQREFLHRLTPMDGSAMISEIFFNMMFSDEKFPMNLWPYALHHALSWFKNVASDGQVSEHLSESSFTKSPLNVAYGLDATFEFLKRGGPRIYTGLPRDISRLKRKIIRKSDQAIFHKRILKAAEYAFESNSHWEEKEFFMSLTDELFKPDADPRNLERLLNSFN